jgi:Cofilin/tropomyosin-type actin-binding protein
MSVSLTDPRISTAYATLQQPTSHIDHILLGYFGSTTISLYNEGSGGIDEVRSYCDPGEVRFALLKMQDKYLFIQFMGEQIRCVKSRYAFSLGRRKMS